MGKYKPFPKTRTFGGKTFENPSFHKKKSDATHIAKKFREHSGNQARVVKGKNILGEIRHVVYRRGRTASSIKRSVQGGAARMPEKIRKRKFKVGGREKTFQSFEGDAWKKRRMLNGQLTLSEDFQNRTKLS